MSKARLIITAVVVEGRSKSEVARDYEVSRYWVQQLVQRWHAEGEAAFEPRSRRPQHSPHAVPAEVEDQIVRLRKELTRQGLDAGADTIRTHLARRTPRSVPDDRSPAVTGPPDFTGLPSVSTIWRILTRRGFVTPQPHKRPRSSWRTFAAEQPNERWQADTTHWQLADGTGVEILNILDDHSRLAPGRGPPPHHHRSRRAPRVPGRLRALGNPRQRAHRQRCGLHRPAPPRRQDRPRGRAGTARHPVRPLPRPPPADLRKGGEIPADREEVARRPAPGQDHRRPATPALPVPPLLQRRATAPSPRPQDALAGLHRPTQGHRHRSLHRPALASPARQGRQGRHRHPAAQQPHAPHRRRPTPAPAPESPCSSTTSTSGSSTATPANSSASSPWTPPGTSNPAESRPDHPRSSPDMQRCPETPVNGVPRHHTSSGGRI